MDKVKHTITVPTNRNDIPLQAVLNWELSSDMEEPDRSIYAISLFCNVSIQDVAEMPRRVVSKALKLLNSVLNSDPIFKDRFKLGGIEYGFVPNLDDLSNGEFIDIEAYGKEPGDLWKVLSVLYRPMVETYGQGKKYEIQPYTGKTNESFKYLPSGIAYGAKVFFCSLGIDLLSYTRKYLTDQIAKTTPQQRITLQANGAGLDTFTYSLAETLQSWKELQALPFIPVYTGRLTDQMWRNWKEALSIRALNN